MQLSIRREKSRILLNVKTAIEVVVHNFQKCHHYNESSLVLSPVLDKTYHDKKSSIKLQEICTEERSMLNVQGPPSLTVIFQFNISGT